MEAAKSTFRATAQEHEGRTPPSVTRGEGRLIRAINQEQPARSAPPGRALRYIARQQALEPLNIITGTSQLHELAAFGSLKRKLAPESLVTAPGFQVR